MEFLDFDQFAKANGQKKYEVYRLQDKRVKLVVGTLEVYPSSKLKPEDCTPGNLMVCNTSSGKSVLVVKNNYQPEEGW